jgi:Ulp1 family protease
VPHPNIFKTKHATRPLVRDEAGSLSDLVARLKQEYPGEYKWKEIDAARKQRDAEIEKLRKPARLPLPKGVKHCVQQIMRGEVPQDEVLIERFNQPIRADDLMTLRPGAWLNDEVINFYMNLINERSKQDSKALKVHCFNTFFYSNFLLPKGYAGVKRFAKRAKVDIASCDMVLVPIHLGVHWCMSAVNRKEKRIEYWDSLRGGSGKVHSKLREYMRNEDPTFAANEAGWRDWIPPSNEAPLQQNGHDCGVFACTTAEYLARGGPVDFDQEDMMDLRVRIAASILDARIY